MSHRKIGLITKNRSIACGGQAVRYATFLDPPEATSIASSCGWQAKIPIGGGASGLRVIHLVTIDARFFFFLKSCPLR